MYSSNSSGSSKILLVYCIDSCIDISVVSIADACYDMKERHVLAVFF